jgi:hypothetical protein
VSTGEIIRVAWTEYYRSSPLPTDGLTLVGAEALKAEEGFDMKVGGKG